MSQCGNAHGDYEETEMCSNCGPSGVSITITTWQTEEYTARILSIQGGCCLYRPLLCHFISTNTCLHQLWKIEGLFGLQQLDSPRNPTCGIVQIPETHLKQPALCSFSRRFLSQWTSGESRMRYSSLWFDFLSLTLIRSVPCLLAVTLFVQLVFALFQPYSFVCFVFLSFGWSNCNMLKYQGRFNSRGRRPWNGRDWASGETSCL